VRVKKFQKRVAKKLLLWYSYKRQFGDDMRSCRNANNRCHYRVYPGSRMEQV